MIHHHVRDLASLALPRLQVPLQNVCSVRLPSYLADPMFHRRIHLGQRTLSGVDLAIDFATLGEYGLVPFSADGSCRERADRRSRLNRRPGWETLAGTRRGACGTGGDGARRSARADWGFPRATLSRADFRAAVERYAA
jgi:hypothetical protein